jgi:hypothetical protein
MIAARAALAVLFRNRSWWWLIYAFLLILIGPLVLDVAYYSGGHDQHW